MIQHTKAYARAGLIGNPSDGYFGKTISLMVRNFGAHVAIYETPRLGIKPGPRDAVEFDGRDALVEDVLLNGYYGGIRLIKAAVKVFSDTCRDMGIPLAARNFTVEYDTDIPVRVGLAGSSAIVTATMRALMTFYEVDIPKPMLPNLILRVETDELGIGAGLQDRVIQVYEGVVFMDFNEDMLSSVGHGVYENLPPENIPPLFIAYDDQLSEGTEVTHNDLRSRWRRGVPEVREAMKTWAALAQEARDLIIAGRGRDIGPLLDANFDLRARLVHISEGNFRLVRTGRDCGAHVKFCGSGGAVIGQYDGDPERLDRIRRAYAAFGAHVIQPQVIESDRTGAQP